jgi:hypothetical protein
MLSNKTSIALMGRSIILDLLELLVLIADLNAVGNLVDISVKS